MPMDPLCITFPKRAVDLRRGVCLAVRMTIPAAPGGLAKQQSVPGAMEWDGAVNAWHVAGDVYRMGRREWLTEGGWRQAYRRGIRTVVDLRNAAEIRRRETDPPVPEAALAGFDVVLVPSDEAIVRGYQRAMRGINEHHRISAVPHPHERFLPEDVLVPLLESRSESLLEFVRSLNTAAYLFRHGVTPVELSAILAKLGR